MEKLSYASESSTSPWTTYLRQIDRVAPYLGDLAYWVETLRHPKRALIVDIPVQMDDGTIRHFEGYRVQHNLSRGPGKGGVRYHPDVDLNEVMALSARMTIGAPRSIFLTAGPKAASASTPSRCRKVNWNA